MKKISCPHCGKTLVNLLPDEPSKSSFFCDECSLDIDIYPDEDTPVSISDSLLRADWYNAGEGICGDYNAEDPDDVNLLRFDIYYNPHYTPGISPDHVDWEEVEDASYCTQVEADTSSEVLIHLLYTIFRKYQEVIEDYLNGSSVKKLGERLSWISSEKVKEDKA